MGDGSFYITLPSNSSMSYFPENTLSSYTTQLPDLLVLNGDYEVGLSEIHYPHAWHAFQAKEEDCFIYVEETRDIEIINHVVTIEHRGFVDIKHLIDTCNNKIKEKLLGITKSYPLIEWDENEQCVVLNNTIDFQDLKKKATFNIVYLSPCLCEALGFNLKFFRHLSIPQIREFGSRSVSQRNYFDQIYVYSDLCEQRYLGDVKASLLRVVPIKGKPGDTISIIYEKLQYVPVVQNRIQTIQLLLRTDTGRPVNFINGRVVVTLHFRKRRLLI